VDWSRYKTDKPQRQKLLDVAKKKDGDLLSPVYLGSHAKHEWRCGKCGTRWWAKAKDVVGKGSWCPTCAHNRKLSVQQIKKLAQDLDCGSFGEYLGMKCDTFFAFNAGRMVGSSNNHRSGTSALKAPKGVMPRMPLEGPLLLEESLT
jgi:DNA-directed RNA polymerase subunit RPC12/RpoP